MMHTQSEIMPPADTVAVQDVLGEIAGQFGIRVIEGPPNCGAGTGPQDLRAGSGLSGGPRRRPSFGHFIEKLAIRRPPVRTR